ncbi:MFS transporter [Flammeovirga aprica]|uniref:MFS transporter n=1 Tax=Flammeovirga aprica JL-4 TaxID=694437 RepID=A0A7X9RT62_9BACT|nr:MFS transporter [Flammeovirga aprica]NME68100.1 MFS transporter [Flammeovirga aprica JL-4]
MTTYSNTQKWTLLTTIMASSLVFIDGSALNVALPALQKEMELTGTQLLWVINGYALFLSALLMVGGALGDLYGRNRIFLIGLVLFSLSSLVCGLSQNAHQLLVARGFQGVGGALLTPGSLSILSAHFDNENRGKAIGLWSTFSALMGIIGPILGGWLAGMGYWRVIFFLNIPLSIFVFFGVFTKVPESKNEEAQQLDGLGALLVTLGLAGVTYGFTESSDLGFHHPLIFGSVSFGIITLFAFAYSQKTVKYPMMPLSLFQSKTFTGANLMTLFLYTAMSGAMFFVPLNLIQIQGYSEVNTGLSMLPIIICIASISPLMGKYIDKNGYQLPLIVGPMIVAVGYFTFTLIGITDGPSTYWTTFLIPFLLIGIGMGIAVAPLTTAVMGSVNEANIGIASGINNTVARVASVLAIALLGAFALFSFKGEVKEKVMALNIENNVQELLIEEADNFTAATPPSNLSTEIIEETAFIYKNAFVVAFDGVVMIAMILAILSGVVSFLMIKD